MKPWLLLWLEAKGVEILSGVKYQEINKEGLVVTTADGKRRTLKASKILTAMPMLADTGLLEKLKGTATEVYALGDTREPGLIFDAVADGARIGRMI